MICSKCEKPIDDNSVACPHCGTAIERSFCPSCGQSLGGASNKKGMVYFMSFVIIALVIVFVVDKSVQFSLPSQPVALPEDARPDERIGYDIITKNSIKMGESNSEEWMIHVDSSSDSAIVEAGLTAINEARSGGSFAQISVYVYVGDAYTTDDQSNWTANLSYIRPDIQDSTVLGASEKIGEDIFIRWNR